MRSAMHGAAVVGVCAAHMATLCLVAAIACAVTDWIAVATERRLLEYVAKPATLGFLLLYAAAGAGTAWFLIAALALSLLGDVYLMLPEQLFPAGLVAFLLAHVAYIAGFDATPLARAGWFAVVAGASIPLARRIIRGVPRPPLRIGVGLYMAIISLMVASAIASGELVAAIGALFFFLSDSLIALDRFVSPIAGGRLAIIVTYHVGQLFLVIALRS
jgi:uncharacterized membrane protein YhhN